MINFSSQSASFCLLAVTSAESMSRRNKVYRMDSQELAHETLVHLANIVLLCLALRGQGFF